VTADARRCTLDSRVRYYNVLEYNVLYYQYHCARENYIYIYIFSVPRPRRAAVADVYVIGLHSTHVNASKYNWSTSHFPTPGEKLPPPRGWNSASRCPCSAIDQTEALATKSPSHFPTPGKKLPPPRGWNSASRCPCSVIDQTEALATKSPCQAPRVGAVAVRPSRPPRLHAAASGAPGPSWRNTASIYQYSSILKY
jgi:hypothetical protein